MSAPDPPYQVPVWTVREIMERVERRVDELEKQVDAIQARVNWAIGGIAVIGVTAFANLITNIIQTPGVTK